MVIVKIGGGADINLAGAIADIAELSEPCVIVHGANALRDQLAKKKVKTLSFFQEIDKDGSGELTKKEFGKAIRDLGFETVPKADIDAVFDQLDPDRSGKISYEELYKILQGLPKKQRSEEGGPAQAPPPLTKQKTSSKQLKRKE